MVLIVNIIELPGTCSSACAVPGTVHLGLGTCAIASTRYSVHNKYKYRYFFFLPVLVVQVRLIVPVTVQATCVSLKSNTLSHSTFVSKRVLVPDRLLKFKECEP